MKYPATTVHWRERTCVIELKGTQITENYKKRKKNYFKRMKTILENQEL